MILPPPRAERVTIPLTRKRLSFDSLVELIRDRCADDEGRVTAFSYPHPTKTGVTCEISFVHDLPITKRNAAQLVAGGRARGKIAKTSRILEADEHFGNVFVHTSAIFSFHRCASFW